MMEWGKIKVGDTIEIEQAWEDNGGACHDETAEVIYIHKGGEMQLKFKNVPLTRLFLNTGLNVKDYQNCIIEKGE